MGGVLAFLGGSAFRMIWGEVSAAFTKAQDHRHEMLRMELQGRLDAAQHDRNLEALRLQSELGVKEIRVQAEAHSAAADDDAWLDVVRATSKPSGFWPIDAWNQGIRPAGATMALLMILLEVVAAGWIIGPETRDVLYAFLGIYVADRSLKNRGK